MESKKTVVKVKSEEEHKLIVETTDGKEQAYYLNPIRTMYLAVHRLQVAQGAYVPQFSGDEVGKPPELSEYIKGDAVLDSDTISVIGEPSNKTRGVSISFHAFDEDECKQLDKLAQENGKTARYTKVTLGFNRGDWETGNEDNWFVECVVSPSTFSAISSAIFTGTLHGLTVGLTLRNIYTNDDWTPPSMASAWFLRPDRKDNTIEFPELACGYIRSLVLDLASVDLGAPPEPEPEPQEEDASESEPIQSDNILPALYALCETIERLRGAILFIGGFIVFFLMVLAFK